MKPSRGDVAYALVLALGAFTYAAFLILQREYHSWRGSKDALATLTRNDASSKRAELIAQENMTDA